MFSEEALYNSLLKTFETIAFMDVERLEERPENFNFSNFMHVKISFEGDHDGVIHALFPRELAGQIAESLYMIEASEQTPEIQEDLVKEIANTYAGLYMAETNDEDKLFTLGFPELVEEFSDLGENSFYYGIEDYIVHLGVK